MPKVDPDRLLSVGEAAWLMRVNDDTLRRWIRSPNFPGAGWSAEQPKVAWADLAAYAVRARKAPPFVPELLHADSTRINELIAGSLPDEPVSTSGAAAECAALRERVQRLEAEATALRLALREKIVGCTHARGDAAASDRALTQMLDAFEARA